MPKWVTIAEAIKITGKSENTIRRLIYNLQKTDKALFERVIIKSSTGAYQIETEFLSAKYPSLSTNEQVMGSTHEIPMGNHSPTHQSTQTPDPIIRAKDETIAILKSQLEKQASEYKEQLNKKDEQMKMMFERMRENNIIMQGPALPTPQKGTAQEHTGVITDTAEGIRKSTHDVPVGNQDEQPKTHVAGTKNQQKKPRSKKPDKPKKKGILSWFS